MSAQANPGASPGDVIAGKYRIEEQLGSGGMGIVFAATHIGLDRKVAVKVVRSDIAEHDGAVERLVREAKLAARFRSEHVCRVLDVGTLADGAPYIVMEYLEGADLATLLSQEGSLDAATAVDFMLETCEALAEAHAAQIIHRDLKPENLFVARLLDGSPSIKVLDFGISKQIGAPASSRNLTNPSAALGSPYYMAPEQMRAARDADSRADIWAVGAILFELVTGAQAFQGETLPEVCAAVMGTEPPRACDMRPELPEALSNAIDRCLKKDPAARFQNVRELALALVPFGSERASSSLARIERTLAGAQNVEGDRFAKDGSGRFRIGVKLQGQTPSSSPGVGSHAPTISATINTASSMPGSERKGKALWIVMMVAVVGAAAGFLFATRHAAERAAAAANHAPVVGHEPESPATLAPPPKLEPPVAQEPAPVPSTSAAEAPAPSASAPPPPPPIVGPAARHRGRAAPVAAPKAPASAAPAPPASQAPAKPKAVQAFDPQSFGPRR